MTLKTSLFNKAIYKSTVKRYIWGSVLYFILLFMLTGMIIFFDVDINNSIRTMERQGHALILDDVYLFFPQFIAYFVPTVVALLIFRFVHSKKTSVFVHSLPVSRTANYISSTLAGLTLMAVPVILNGIILILMSLFGYGKFFDVSSCFIWMGINLTTLFFMFSASAFSAMLTGNSFSMVVINALVHSIDLIFAAAFSGLASTFIYGYFDTNQLLYSVMEWNFVPYLIEMSNNISRNATFDTLRFIILFISSVLLYALGLLFYKKRKMETAEDVAAFKCLNPIYKYLVTFTASLGVFALFCYTINKTPMLPILVTLITSIVVYFGAEMLLKKTFKVWRTYKGYLVFLLGFTLMILFFAYTSFFGYESRIPKLENVEEVAVYDFYYQNEEPYSSSADIIKYAASVHKELTEKEKIYTVKDYDYSYDTALHIKYKLKNGKIISRRYPVFNKTATEVMETLYKSKDYKLKHSSIFRNDVAKIYQISLDHEACITDQNQMKELMNAVEKDILALDYTEVTSRDCWTVYLSAEYIRPEDLDMDEKYRGIYNIYTAINANYKNTVLWLKENGYSDFLFNRRKSDLCILSIEDYEKYTDKEETYTASYGKGQAVTIDKINKFMDLEGIDRISDEKSKKIISDFVTERGVRYNPDREYLYYVFSINNDGYLERVASFYKEGDELIKLLNK